MLLNTSHRLGLHHRHTASLVLYTQQQAITNIHQQSTAAAAAAVRHRHLPHQRQLSRRSTCSRALMLNEVQLLSEGLNPAALLLPGVTATLAGAAALKFYLYSQLEIITAKMLGKYVPTGTGTGARVIQLGGGTRELYYYPKDVVLVTNVGEKVNKGLMEQAGVTAAVPTRVKQQPITDLKFQPNGSVDAVVALGVLSDLPEQQQRQCLQEITRVLKPGMPLVFIEPLAEGGSPLRGLIGVSGGRGTLSTSQLEAWKQSGAFSYVEWDTALSGQDPHAVGVAVRSERAAAAAGAAGAAGQDDGYAGASRRRKKQPKTTQGFSSSSSSSSSSNDSRGS